MVSKIDFCWREVAATLVGSPLVAALLELLGKAMKDRREFADVYETLRHVRYCGGHGAEPLEQLRAGLRINDITLQISLADLVRMLMEDGHARGFVALLQERGCMFLRQSNEDNR